MNIIVVETAIKVDQVKELAKNQFGDLVKATVDIEKRIIALGGELHADEEALLLETGSQQSNLWGINIYPFNQQDAWIEFDSMINIRPRDENFSRDVTNENIRKEIIKIVHSLIYL